MTDQRDKTSNGTQNPIPRTATAGELLAVKNMVMIIFYGNFSPTK